MGGKMFEMRTWYLVTALLLCIAAIEPSSADSPGKLSTAQDYWSASKISFQLASKHNRLNETQAACEALTKSLDYYRMALAKDSREVTLVSSDGGDGMQEIRSQFGCTRAQFS
jgi:hypothetical protein